MDEAQLGVVASVASRRPKTYAIQRPSGDQTGLPLLTETNGRALPVTSATTRLEPFTITRRLESGAQENQVSSVGHHGHLRGQTKIERPPVPSARMIQRRREERSSRMYASLEPSGDHAGE